MDSDDFARVKPGSGQSITTGATAVTSAAWGAQTYAIRLACTAACHVEFGGAAATANSMLLNPSSYGEYFKVQPGATLSVIQDSAAGKLSITEVAG